MQEWTLTFEQQEALSLEQVGGKGHGLALMAQAGIPVAPGFIIAANAHRHYLEATGLGIRLTDAIRNLDRNAFEHRDQLAREVMQWFDEMPMPDDVRAAILQGYTELSQALQLPDLAVAVRSSATAEDSAGASFAGEFETYVGIKGHDAVELHVRRCWASVFASRALGYAWKNDIDPLSVNMAVVVQKVVNARAAGVMFTISPTTGDRSRIVIEACHGLGLGVVGGEVTPDRFVIAKIEGHIVDRLIGDKHIAYDPDGKAHPVDESQRGQVSLSDQEALELAKVGKKLERMRGIPQDIEFAIDKDLPEGDNFILLQCRPVTVTAPKTPSGLTGALEHLTASVLSAAR